MKLDLPPPRDWQAFEDLCRDLWAELWDDPNAAKHGRTGQKQRGVDVFGQPGGGADWEGVEQVTAAVAAVSEELGLEGEGLPVASAGSPQAVSNSACWTAGGMSTKTK